MLLHNQRNDLFPQSCGERGLFEKLLALVQLILLAAGLILALVLCLLGYVFLVASTVAGLAHLAGISWTWAALAVAGAFIIALILLLVARNRRTKRFARDIYPTEG